MPRSFPTRSLAPSVAPSLAPSLTWPGRTWLPGATPEDARDPPLVVIDELFTTPGVEPGRLVHGDCLDVARALSRSGLERKVDLVYIDPPFASQASYVHEARLDGPADGRVERTPAYHDLWPTKRGAADAGDGIAAYLDMLAPRLEAMAALLAPTGSLWVHVDWRASYLVRVLLDEVMGRRSFLNEIVWRRAPNLGRQAASGQFGRTLDTLVVYGGPRARLVPPTRLEPVPSSGIRRDEDGRAFTTAPRGDYTDESMARLAGEGRVHTTATGRMYVKYFLVPNQEGELCRERRIDTLWTDVPPLRHARPSERTGFPTQKPLALLERVIACATPKGGTVVDLFAGSGTTGEAAHGLGRRFVLGDKGAVAMNIARARLLRRGVPLSVERCGDVVAPGAVPPELTVVPSSRDEVTVELVSPAEPLGWAVGAQHGPGTAFVASWHSERRPGAAPVRAARSATVAASEARQVRVYADDGTVGHAPVTVARGGAFAEAR